MDHEQILQAVLQSEFLFVGELRGAKAERYRTVDSESESGPTLESARVRMITEAFVDDSLERLLLTLNVSDMVEAEAVAAELIKGRRYVFFPQKLYRQHGNFAAWIGRPPFLVSEGEVENNSRHP